MRFFPVAATALIVGLAGVAVLTRPMGVSAGTAVRMDIAELVQGAELVIEGHVLSSAVFQSEHRIETEFLIEVERTFVGADEPYRSFRLPGGVLEDGSGMILAGMPRIAAGEDTLLFLSGEGTTGVRMPVGLSQGKFRVMEMEDGGKSLIRDAAGVTLVDQSGRLIRAEGQTVLDYAHVTAEIEAALATREAR